MIPLNVNNPFHDAPIYFQTETDSTMNDAEELMRQGAVSGTVVAAGFQRNGRGRFSDRRWESDTGESLLFTILLDRSTIDHRTGVVPLLVGLGVARFVQYIADCECRIKWPNDVLVGGKKVSGILCQAKSGFYLAGVGINCKQERFREYPNLTATSLRVLGARKCEPLELLEDVLKQINAALILDRPLERVASMLYLKGREVTVENGLPGKEMRLRGILAGIGTDGQLLIRRGPCGETLEVYSGQLVVDASSAS